MMHSAFAVESRVTLAETTSNFVVRSEHLFHGKEHYRHTIRKHFHEVIGGEGPAQGGSLCVSQREDDDFGEYLGFVDFRAIFDASAVALALLAVPRHIREERDADLITGLYGWQVGGPAFSCTVYSMQDMQTTGSVCAQACLIMLLMMLTDRGARVEGSYTLTYWAKRRLPKSSRVANRDDPPEILDEFKTNLAAIDRAFTVVDGLNQFEMMAAIEQANVRPHYLHIENDLKDVHDLEIAPAEDKKRNSELVDLLALRVIQAYVRSRFPLILQVENYIWTDRTEPDRVGGHAVVIVGVTRAGSRYPNVRLVIHDPGRQPYLRRPLPKVLEAARWIAEKVKEGEPPERPAPVRLITATDLAVRTDPLRCLGELRSIPSEKDLIDPYFKDWKGHGSCEGTDLRFTLVYRREVSTLVAQLPVSSDVRSAIDSYLQLNQKRYWCIACYRDRDLKIAWLFPAELDCENSDREIVRIERTLSLEPKEGKIPFHLNVTRLTIQKPERASNPR